jgi:hypothetical protein
VSGCVKHGFERLVARRDPAEASVSGFVRLLGFEGVGPGASVAVHGSRSSDHRFSDASESERFDAIQPATRP